MIPHHPSEASLLACAAGTLPEPHARVIAVHAAQCSDCSNALREADAIGGMLLDGLPPETLQPDALTRILSRLDIAPTATSQMRIQPYVAPVTLAALATGRWWWTAPGVSIMRLLPRDTTGTRLDLIRVAPGTGLLQHSHTGLEMTCVLQGAFNDGIDEYFPGDIAEGDAGLDHHPVALPGQTCVCLIATTGSLRVHGSLKRVMRSLIGM